MLPKRSDSRKTILFADSEDSRRESISALLRESGYHLLSACVGREAVQKAREHSGPIHLLLANVEMTEMSGIDLGYQLTRQRPDMKIFLLSYRDSGIIILGRGWQFLPARFALEMLRNRIRDILQEPPWPANNGTSDSEGADCCQSLTERESQVLKLIASGQSTKQIAVSWVSHSKRPSGIELA